MLFFELQPNSHVYLRFQKSHSTWCRLSGVVDAPQVAAPSACWLFPIPAAHTTLECKTQIRCHPTMEISSGKYTLSPNKTKNALARFKPFISHNPNESTPSYHTSAKCQDETLEGMRIVVTVTLFNGNRNAKPITALKYWHFLLDTFYSLEWSEFSNKQGHVSTADRNISKTLRQQDDRLDITTKMAAGRCDVTTYTAAMTS